MINPDLYSLIYPGRVVEYFEATQTATVRICAERIFSNTDETDGLAQREFLYDVPVQTPSGGGWAMTMPVKAGDTCILFFSQVGYDHWLFEDKDEAGVVDSRANPVLKRQFSEDDGFALVGMNPIPRAVQSYTADGSQWRNSDATQSIHLKDDLSIVIDSLTKVTINAPVVEVNSTTAIVNSDNVDVNADIATIDATTSAAVTTPAFNVNSPLATFSGLIQCTGIGAGASPVAGKMAVSGTVESTGDMVAGGISLQSHTHNENGTGGGVTNPPN